MIHQTINAKSSGMLSLMSYSIVNKANFAAWTFYDFSEFHYHLARLVINNDRRYLAFQERLQALQLVEAKDCEKGLCRWHSWFAEWRCGGNTLVKYSLDKACLSDPGQTNNAHRCSFFKLAPQTICFEWRQFRPSEFEKILTYYPEDIHPQHSS